MTNIPSSLAKIQPIFTVEIRKVFEIGTDFVDYVEFHFPDWIDDKLIDDVKRVIELVQSKSVVVNFIPIEMAESFPLIKDLTIKATYFSDLSKSVFSLKMMR